MLPWVESAGSRIRRSRPRACQREVSRIQICVCSLCVLSYAVAVAPSLDSLAPRAARAVSVGAVRVESAARVALWLSTHICKLEVEPWLHQWSVACRARLPFLGYFAPRRSIKHDRRERQPRPASRSGVPLALEAALAWSVGYGARSPRVGVPASARRGGGNRPDATRNPSGHRGQRERHVTQCHSNLNAVNRSKILKYKNNKNVLSRDRERAAHALKPRCGTKLSRVPSPGLAPGR